MSGRRWWSTSLLLAAAVAAWSGCGQRVAPFGATPAAPSASAARAFEGRGTTSEVRYALEVGGSLHTLIPRDSIRPIYEPTFISPAEAGLMNADLVIGLSLNGDSRAYPVHILRRREMVNDVVGGVPVLATW